MATFRSFTGYLNSDLFSQIGGNSNPTAGSATFDTTPPATLALNIVLADGNSDTIIEGDDAPGSTETSQDPENDQIAFVENSSGTVLVDGIEFYLEGSFTFTVNGDTSTVYTGYHFETNGNPDVDFTILPPGIPDGVATVQSYDFTPDGGSVPYDFLSSGDETISEDTASSLDLSGDDVIIGGDGDDTITDNAGSNVVDGGAGDDTITLTGGAESDTVFGGDGEDNITVFNAAGANNTVFGGADNDTVQTGDSTDVISGGTGDDTIDAGRGDDRIYGGDGNDDLVGFEGDDVIYGDNPGPARADNPFNVEYYELSGPSIPNLAAAGFDAAGNNSNVPTAELVRDDLNVGAISLANGGDRETYAVRFETTLNVTEEGTYTFTTSSDDGSKLFIDGVEVVDNDGLHGTQTQSGSLTLDPGEHEVVIIFFEQFGGDNLSATISGPDTGGAAIDLTTADISAPSDGAPVTPGEDTIDGGAGDDLIFGEGGDDTIDGGADDDTITGGAGNDTFVETAGDGADVITDFNVGNTGSIDDDDQTNNDFVDLSAFYNDANTTAVNNADADPSNDFKNGLEVMRADAADGRLDGVIGGTDYSAQIGEIDLTLQDGSGGAVTGADLTFDNTNVVCFARGTTIKTAKGQVLIENLKVGDHVLTLDNAYQPISWIGSRKIDAIDLSMKPKLKPIRIRAGALGKELPERDLYVSYQHRVLVRSLIAERIFGECEVLVPANKLLVLPGIDILEDCEEVEYFHMLFQRHEIVWSNGALTESLFTGPEALKSVPPASRAEIEALFPEILNVNYTPESARLIPKKGKLLKELAFRHGKNQKDLVETADLGVRFGSGQDSIISCHSGSMRRNSGVSPSGPMLRTE